MLTHLFWVSGASGILVQYAYLSARRARKTKSTFWLINDQITLYWNILVDQWSYNFLMNQFWLINDWFNSFGWSMIRKLFFQNHFGWSIIFYWNLPFFISSLTLANSLTSTKMLIHFKKKIIDNFFFWKVLHVDSMFGLLFRGRNAISSHWMTYIITI